MKKGAFAGCYNLGLMYFKGEHIKNYTKAEEYFSKVCNKGHQNLYYNLANMYEKGLGVEKDNFKAVDLYKTCKNGVSSSVLI